MVHSHLADDDFVGLYKYPQEAYGFACSLCIKILREQNIPCLDDLSESAFYVLSELAEKNIKNVYFDIDVYQQTVIGDQ